MRIISLFSGAGGLDLGLIQAGNDVVWANDIDALAVETYRKNIGDHIVCKDIKDVDMAEIPDGADVVILPHPNGLRRMSGRELATVQGFPIDYEFKGPLSSVYRQIGNAVPPPFAKAIASQFNSYRED